MAYDPSLWEGFDPKVGMTPAMLKYFEQVRDVPVGHYVGEGDNAMWTNSPLDYYEITNPNTGYTIGSHRYNTSVQGENSNDTPPRQPDSWTYGGGSESDRGLYGKGYSYKPTGEYWDEASRPNQQSAFMKWMPYVVGALATMGVGAVVAGGAAAAAGAGAGAAEGAGGAAAAGGLSEAGTAAALDAASAQAAAAGASYEAGGGLMGAYNSLPAWQQAALQGAGKGAISSGVQGQDPWKGALMGAVTGGVGSAAGSAISGAGGDSWMAKLGSMGASKVAGMAAGGLMGGGSTPGAAAPGMTAGSKVMPTPAPTSTASGTGMMGAGSPATPGGMASSGIVGPEKAFFDSTFKPRNTAPLDTGPYAYAAEKLRQA